MPGEQTCRDPRTTVAPERSDQRTSPCFLLLPRSPAFHPGPVPPSLFACLRPRRASCLLHATHSCQYPSIQLRFDRDFVRKKPTRSRTQTTHKARKLCKCKLEGLYVEAASLGESVALVWTALKRNTRPKMNLMTYGNPLIPPHFIFVSTRVRLRLASVSALQPPHQLVGFTLGIENTGFL